jgi:hypothetical protein
MWDRLKTASEVSEAERKATEAELLARWPGAVVAVDKAGGSPYDPEDVVVSPRKLGRGERVEIRPVVKSHDGSGRYKGRGRWRTIILVVPAPEGPWAVCDPGDRGADGVGYSGVHVRPAGVDAAEQATGGLGGAAAELSAAFAALAATSAVTELAGGKPGVAIISRHPATVEWLKGEATRLGMAEPKVVSGNATAEDVVGKVVLGNIPMHLAKLTARTGAVEFTGAPPRGAEYSAADMVAAGARISWYRVSETEAP